jgi:hypothetical protein
MKLLTALKTKLPLRGDNGTKTTIYVAFEIITGWNMEGCMYVYMIRIEESNDNENLLIYKRSGRKEISQMAGDDWPCTQAPYIER